jgi:Ca2+-binding RTX toxin-like protein
LFNDEGGVAAVDITPLSNGGYALVYALELADAGIFVQQFDANGVALGSAERIDGPGNLAPFDSEDRNDNAATIVPLANGGFAVEWLADTGGDGIADTFAIQRYDSSGAKDGSVVLLQDLPAALVNAPDGIGEVAPIALTALENGGYALTYKVQFPEASEFVSTFGNPYPILISFQPTMINLFSPSPGTTFFLDGTNNGAPVSVQLTPVNGVIEISQAILDQFSIDNRFTFRMEGGSASEVLISGVETSLYTGGSTLHEEARSLIADGDGSATLQAVDGRVESFEIDGLMPSGADATFTMIIVPASPLSFNPADVPGASVQSWGVVITGLTPDANGVIAVPQPILEALGGNDADVVLQVDGLTPGSTVTGSVSVREGIALHEGVFVATFDANGVPVSDDLNLVGTARDDHLLGDVGDDVLNGLGGDNVLTGAGGSDVFKFDSVPNGSNQITDFQQGSDHIDLSGIDANSGTAGNDGFTFIGTQAFSAVAGELRFEIVSGHTLVSADLDGDGTPDFQIELVGSYTLNSQDFVL